MRAVTHITFRFQIENENFIQKQITMMIREKKILFIRVNVVILRFIVRQIHQIQRNQKIDDRGEVRRGNFFLI